MGIKINWKSVLDCEPKRRLGVRNKRNPRRNGKKKNSLKWRRACGLQTSLTACNKQLHVLRGVATASSSRYKLELKIAQ